MQPSGAKARTHFQAFNGATEVVPFQNIVPFQNNPLDDFFSTG